MTTHFPFSEDDRVNLDQSLLRLDDADKTIKRAEMAGIDVTQQKKDAKETRSKLMKLKNAFFSGS